MNGAENGTRLVDIARDCCLSLRVVNAIMTGYSGNVRYSPETKKRVLEAAGNLVYRPNRFARNLQAGRCGAIAVLVENFFDITELTLNAIIQTAKEHSTMTFLEKVGPDNPTPKCFSEKMSDGFIVIGHVSESLTAEIDRTGSPCVFVNSNRRKGTNCVTFDEKDAMKLAVERFLSRGRKRIAFISAQPGHYSVEERINGLEVEIRKRGLAKLKALEPPPDISETAFQNLISDFLRGNPEINAVLLCSDDMAPVFYDAAGKIGRNIPSDISVIAVNNSIISRYVRPSITSLGIDGTKVGRIAVEKLESILEGKKVSLSKLKYKLIPRDSA
jgi:LacI family transcriptional regulator